jgi:hypothetical protein
MLNALRDFLLSYCPAPVRSNRRPHSALWTLRAAIWGGLAQFFLFALVLALQFKNYFAYRAQQLAPHMDGTNEVVQAGFAVIVTLEFLIHPLSLLLLYLAIEGLIRFAGGVVAAEVVPNLVVFLAFKTVNSAIRLRRQQRSAATVPDTLEKLPDGRLRISSGQPKPGWNASITIGVNGQWFEVDRERPGMPPHDFIYILRPAHAGKILRGYEEYDVGAAIVRGTASRPKAGDRSGDLGGAAAKK